MKQTAMKKILCFVLCAMLLCSVTMGLAGCGSTSSSQTETAAEVSFQVVVTGPDGEEACFDIATNKSTVGEALVETGLISGEDSDYGLYVTTVNGITLDWDADQMYWAFYIDGEYAMTGVDSTEVTPGAVYSFVAEG